MKIIPALLALLALAACHPEAEIPDDPPPLPVKVEKAGRAPFQPTLVLLGVVRPSQEAEVVLPSAGRLRYPGRFRGGLTSGVQVGKGEVLAQLVNTDTESGIAEAKLRLEVASSDLARYQKAFDLGVTAGRSQQAEDHPQRRGLSRAVGAEQAVHFAALDAK